MRCCCAAGATSASARRSTSISTSGRSAAGAVLLARQQQELVDEVGRAFDAGVQAQHGALARRVVGRACQAVHLQLQCRQWRTQFVRGVGDEALLRVEGVLQAAEEAVQLMHQRPDLVG